MRPVQAAPGTLVNSLPGELAEAIVGSLFIACGVVTLVAGLAARPRRVPIAVWFGVFSVMYGVRLGSKSDLVRAVTGWPDTGFLYTDAFITYSILVPVGLFTESTTGPGRGGVVRRLWQLTAVYAACAMANDLIRARPAASMWLNAPVVLTTIPVFLWHVAGRSRATGRWPADVRAVAAAGALFTLVAFYETVFQQPPFGLPFDLEPPAMLLLLMALGWSVLSRMGEQASEYAALSRELRLARDIQQSLLPQRMPVIPGLRLTGRYLPMSAVAGDFYDVATRADGRVVVIVADVSGHGVPAALVASMVKVAFAAEVERYERPGEILGGINRALVGKFERAYVTACCAAIDRSGGTLSYAAAGHPPAVLRRRAGALQRIEEGGIALTLMPQASYATTDLAFDPGDRLLLFTDGLIEAVRPGSDDFFGDAELDRAIAALGPHADAAQAVLDAHRQWIGAGTPLADDVTLVVVEATA
jgi:sigma-B regulation protein RsbU (phosphoserine phosphatase)